MVLETSPHVASSDPPAPSAVAAPLAPRRVTLKDLALATGLSKATVSRALSSPEENEKLKPETRSRILQAAEQLGYRVNWRARAFASRKTMAVGMLFFDARPVLDGVYQLLARSLTLVLQRRGYHLVFLPVDTARDDWKSFVEGQRVDGVVALHRVSHEVVSTLTDSGMPAVLLNTGADSSLAGIDFDDQQGARDLAAHLLDLGHRHVAMFVDRYYEPHYSISERRSGLELVMRSRGGHVEFWDDTPAVNLQRYLALSPRERPTALFCYSHFEAVWLLRQLRLSGLEVPRHVSVACFNDIFPVAETVPSLTTVAVPQERMGRLGAAMLVRLIERGKLTPRPRVRLSEQLVVRESTGRI